MGYRYDEGVVVVSEGEALLAQLDIHLLQVHYVEPLVVLFDGGPYHHLLLLGIHIQLVDLCRVGQVADAPLEAFQSIPSEKDGLSDKESTVFEAFINTSLLPFSSISPISNYHFVSLNCAGFFVLRLSNS